jgi:hypothetical protein
MLKANLKRWEDVLPFVEFAYNRSIHSATRMTPFEIVYGLNPKTPVDLTPQPYKEKESFDATKRADFVKKLHERTRMHLERKSERYKAQADKGRKQVIFEEGDLVWVHLRKERFPQKRKNKLNQRGDGPFKVLKRIGPNAYQLELPGEYNVHTTFNVADLSLYVPDLDSDVESETIRAQVEENDADKAAMTPNDVDELIRVPFDGPITRNRAKKIQEGTKALLVRLAAVIHESEKKKWVTMIHHQSSPIHIDLSQEWANAKPII